MKVFLISFIISCIFCVKSQFLSDESLPLNHHNLILDESTMLQKVNKLIDNMQNSGFLVENEEAIETSESSSSSIFDGVKINCYWVNVTTFETWDLTPLARKSDEDELIINSNKGKMAYNFCGNTKVKCDGKGESQAAALLGDATTCYKQLAGDSKKFNYWKIRNPNNSTDGVKIIMNQGETCSGDIPFIVEWDLKCNDKLEKGKLKFLDEKNIDITSCMVKIQAESKHGK